MSNITKQEEMDAIINQQKADQAPRQENPMREQIAMMQIVLAQQQTIDLTLRNVKEGMIMLNDESTPDYVKNYLETLLRNLCNIPSS